MQPKVERTCRFCRQVFQGTVTAGTCRHCQWRHRKGQAPASEEARAIVARMYNPSVRGRVGEIARKLGKSRGHVTRIAEGLGLVQSVQITRWTPAEITSLERWATEKSIAWMAGRLRRSRTSVRQKLLKLRLSGRVANGNTVQSLAVCFGVSHRTIETWVHQGLLSGAHDRQGNAWVIEDGEIRRFIRENPSVFCLYKVDQLWFLDLVFEGRIGSEVPSGSL